MATTTSAPNFAGHIETGAVPTAPSKGFFARLFESFTASQMRRAEAHVRVHLAQLSNERLSDLGFTTDEAKAIRAKGTVPTSYWL